MDEYELINPEHNDVIRGLLREMERHCLGEAGHAERVAVMAVATGEKMGLRFEQLLRLRQAAALHDVGKIMVNRELLQKLDKLTAQEVAEIRLHAQQARKVVESIDWLAPALPMIVHHHEWWDGSGYPDGLSGDEIPLGARIIAVAEAFDALTQGVGWRDPVEEDAALRELNKCAGSQFDPRVVEAFLEVQPLIQPVRY